MEQLTPAQTQYIKERGFEIITGEPPRDQPFPYMTLREEQKYFEEAEITYHQSPYFRSGMTAVTHPSNMDVDKLVNLIETSVADGMSLENHLFNTTPGQPIKVFVQDPAWNTVTETLIAKYK